MKLLRGAGGLIVFLDGGVQTVQTTEGLATAYLALDQLYASIGKAIARGTGAMSGEEVRFLRKRLGLSQEDLGAIGGKKAQVAAKWEKGQLPMPAAEAKLLRLKWLQKFSPAHVAEVLEAPSSCTRSGYGAGCYSFHFDGNEWRQIQGTQPEETHYTAALAAREAIRVISARDYRTALTSPDGAPAPVRRLT